MIELLLLIGIVYGIGKGFGDHAGTVALAILIIGLVVAFASACRKGDRAFGNFVDYWSEGGPDRRDRR